ncbi:glycoside hydrolase family 36 protein [Streptomyces sp. NPDC093544]|uniref:glycoside hydrolase family 36 protein n=1 Tax=Streptomyces sp. NPDC093544 TaxID=3155200 RepID=UPI003427B689
MTLSTTQRVTSGVTTQPVTTAELPPARYEPLLDGVRIAVLAHATGVGAHWTMTELDDGQALLEIRTDGVPAPTEVRMSVPLGDAAGYWHPGAGWERTLVADWAGRSRVSLVDGTAAGCLYDHDGRTRLTFAVADPVPETDVVFGVSEENDTHVVHLHLAPAPDGGPRRILLARSAPTVATALRGLREWFGAQPQCAPMPVPDSARAPVYSTWYAFNQRVDAASVEAEADVAATLGCEVLILDDGWQEYGNGRGYAGCGDWRPDPVKFPDFTEHVSAVRAQGMRYLAWVAPLLLGPGADCAERLAPYAPAPAGVPGAHVLDPRRPEVRDHVIRLCTRLVADHGLDGLKIDFLDEAMAYRGDGPHAHAEGTDISDVGQAMTVLLTDLRTALEELRPDGELLLELRQPYVGPGMAPFGNMLRSFDCPGDATGNRVRTLDTAMLAVGGAVHGDMLLWDRDAPAHAVARQLIGSLHSVPQISVRLTDLSHEHRETLAFWLAEWRRLRPVLLHGDVEPGRPDDLYTLVTAVRGTSCVTTVHSDRVVPVDTLAYDDITLVNGTASDRLVIEVSGGQRPLRMTVRDERGRIIDDCERSPAPGPHIVPVPRSGLVALRVAEGNA